MMRGAILAAMIIVVVSSGCAALGPSESERALQTQVAQQATQLAELQASPTGVSVGTAAAGPSPSATETEPAPVPTEGGGGEVVDAGPCTLVADGEVTVYGRPHLDAAVFGSMTAGLRVQLQVRTVDGWWGFEPGVAQAANVGIFRLRWVHENAPAHVEGSCGDLPEVEGPPAGICFDMPMEGVDVYASPDTSSDVVATLTLGDYAAVVGMTDGWAKLDLAVGNTGLDTPGWIPAATLNMNGPCENLPTLEP
jgi:hypothetical protein